MKTTTNRANKKNTSGDLAIIVAFEDTTLKSWEPAYNDLRVAAEAAAARMAG